MGILSWIKDYFRDIRKSFSNTFKSVVLTAHFWVLLVSVALMITLGIMIFNTLNDRRDQNMGKVWQNDGKISYRQMSVFAKGNKKDVYAPPVSLGQSESLTLEEDSLVAMRTQLQSTVDSGKTVARKKNSKFKPSGWEDCYSTTFRAQGCYTKVAEINGVTRTANMDIDAEIVAVGGNFAAFHPFEYVSGGFLPVEPVDENQIVINDELSWKLFKSYDVTGLRIELWGEDFTIIGVVREKKNSIDQITGASKERIFCYFSKIDSLNSKGYFLGENAGAGEGEEGLPNSAIATPLAITCYEAFLPEIVKGVAKNDVLNALPSYNISDPQFRIVSNTGRFRVDNVYDFNMPIGEFQSKTSAFEFPYWEKAAILATQRLFLMEIGMLIGIFLFLVGIIIMILRLRKPGGKFDKIEKITEEDEIEDVAIQMS